jgi:hypothetical protein
MSKLNDMFGDPVAELDGILNKARSWHEVGYDSEIAIATAISICGFIDFDAREMAELIINTIKSQRDEIITLEQDIKELDAKMVKAGLYDDR